MDILQGLIARRLENRRTVSSKGGVAFSPQCVILRPRFDGVRTPRDGICTPTPVLVPSRAHTCKLISTGESWSGRLNPNQPKI